MVLYEKVFKDDKGNEAIISYRCDIQCPHPLWHAEKEEAWWVKLWVLNDVVSYFSISAPCTARKGSED